MLYAITKAACLAQLFWQRLLDPSGLLHAHHTLSKMKPLAPFWAEGAQAAGRQGLFLFRPELSWEGISSIPLLQTIENTREADVTMVQPDDEEVAAEEDQDEFAGGAASILKHWAYLLFSVGLCSTLHNSECRRTCWEADLRFAVAWLGGCWVG